MARFLLVLIGLCLFLSANWTCADTGVDLLQLSRSQQWLRLLHYKSRFPFGNLRSEVEPGSFFFSPDGRRDPYAELKANVAAFESSKNLGKTGSSLQCSFPARYHFLKTHLNWQWVDDKCPELDAFLKKVGGDKLSIVFSSAYPNSPPSMFGHTMLRVHSRERAELLDYGINYSASASADENALAFAVFGLTGGYFGKFGVVPYYMKVNEYNHAESRDLWEYDLNLTPSEIQIFLWHLWELDQHALFRYYFFDENCSYRILTLLEVAKPEWNLSQFAIEVIPAETIKRLTLTPGAVTAIHHRPSLHVQMRERFDLLTPDQNESALQIIHGDLPPSDVSDTAPLEAAVSYFQYRRLRGENHLEDSDQKIYTALLLQRAKQGRTPDTEILPVPQSSRDTQPDLGHSPYLLGVGGGVLEEGTRAADFSELHFRFAYHDLLNKDLGYIRFSEVEFPSLSLRYSATLHSLWIEKLGVLSVFSLFPMTELEKRPSWKVDFSYISPKDLNCVDCHALMLEGGAGAAKGLLSDHLLFYGMALLHLEAGSSIQNGVRFMPKLLTAALANPFTNYKSRLSGAVVADVGQSSRQSHFYELKWDQSLSLSQNWEMRLNAEVILPGNRQTNVTYEEYSLSLNHYF